MIDRRDVLVGSATALAASLTLSSSSAVAQGVVAPGTKRGERTALLIYLLRFEALSPGSIAAAAWVHYLPQSN